MIGTGFSTRADSHAAGKHLADQALSSLGDVAPGWAIAFTTARHDPAALLDGLRTRLGNIPVVGGAAFGVYTREGRGHAGAESGVAVFCAESVPGQVFAEPLGEATREAGRRLGERLAQAARPGDSVLLFYDFVRQADPFINYASSELLDGLYDAIEPGSLFITGGATIGDFKFSSSFIYAGDDVMYGGVVAVLIPQHALRPDHQVTHGCAPISTYLEVTACEGREVIELDGKPALDVLIDVAGLDEINIPLPSVMDLWLTLGVNYGDPWGEFDENDYVNYLISASDVKKRTLSLTELAPPVGTRVRVMAREHGRLVKHANLGVERLIQRLPAPPAFVFVTNCAGRITPFAGSQDGDGIYHTEALPEGPYLGFFCACELAPFDGVTRSMNWTEVMTCFSAVE